MYRCELFITRVEDITERYELVLDKSLSHTKKRLLTLLKEFSRLSGFVISMHNYLITSSDELT